MPIPVDILKTHPDAEIPAYQTSGSCAFDLCPIEDAIIQPEEIVRLRTGLVICVPEGHTLIVAARSSLPKKKGLHVPQAFGIVDQDYCGPEDEMFLQLRNFTNKPVEVKKGERLCQALIVPITLAEFNEVDSLTAPNRGGFGSTG